MEMMVKSLNLALFLAPNDAAEEQSAHNQNHFSWIKRRDANMMTEWHEGLDLNDFTRGFTLLDRHKTADGETHNAVVLKDETARNWIKEDFFFIHFWLPVCQMYHLVAEWASLQATEKEK